MLHLRVIEHIVHGVDRRAGNGVRLHQLHQFDALARCEDFLHLAHQFHAVVHAQLVGGVARVVSQFAVAERNAHAPEHIVGRRGNQHFPVRAGVYAGGRAGRRAVADTLRQHTVAEVIGHGHGGGGDGGVEQREVDVLAFARGLVAVVQRGEDGAVGVDAADEVGDRHTDAHHAAARHAVRMPGHAHQAAHGLEDRVVAGTRRVRSGLTETGDGAVHQLAIHLAQAFVIQAVALQVTGLVVFDQHVGPGRELAHQFLAFGVRDVDGDALLVAVRAGVHGREFGRLAVLGLQRRAAEAARIVAGAGLFHLDDFGAEVAQHLRGGRAGEDAGQIENTNAFKRSGCD